VGGDAEDVHAAGACSMTKKAQSGLRRRKALPARLQEYGDHRVGAENAVT
jgi:hypothetical protein